MNDSAGRSLSHLAGRYVDQLVSFCRRLVQTPSLPGEERDVARLIRTEMESLGYDEVWVDDWGNVAGLLKGEGPGASVMFNGHMDHVDPGDPQSWPYPPYGGEIHDGRLWGRGVADMKGPLAAMIYAGGVLSGQGLRPAGHLYVTAVVQEEVGGLGTQKLVQAVHPDLAVVGEATSNQLARGHRGRIELVVKVRGKSAHASVPGEGVNPHAVLARFLQRLETLPLIRHETFGASNVAPTLYQTDQRSSNVVPGAAQVHLDWRNVPGEATDDVIAQLQPVLNACLAEVEGSRGELLVHTLDLRTYTGRAESFPAVFPSYELDASHPLVRKGQQVLTDALSHPVDVVIWDFATDGGHLMQAGVPTIGFGPAEADKLHTVVESVPLDMLSEGLLGYTALALELGEPPA